MLIISTNCIQIWVPKVVHFSINVTSQCSQVIRMREKWEEVRDEGKVRGAEMVHTYDTGFIGILL